MGVLNDIEKVVAHPAHLVHRNMLAFAKDAGLTAKADIQRLSTEVFAELKKLKQTHTLRPAVIPWPPAFLSLNQGANRVFPIVGSLNGAAFDNTTAGKTNEARFQVSYQLGDVRSKTIRPTSPGCPWE